jgi:hypothetical protein
MRPEPHYPAYHQNKPVIWRFYAEFRANCFSRSPFILPAAWTGAQQSLYAIKPPVIYFLKQIENELVESMKN